MKAVPDSDLPSWALSEKVGQKYSLARCVPTKSRAEQPCSNVFKLKKSLHWEFITFAHPNKSLLNKRIRGTKNLWRPRKRSGKFHINTLSVLMSLNQAQEQPIYHSDPAGEEQEGVTHAFCSKWLLNKHRYPLGSSKAKIPQEFSRIPTPTPSPWCCLGYQEATQREIPAPWRGY